ncbi:uncharacterized protein LOC144158234 isoform X5 [Haemaphysalis longicornis]
MSTARIKLLPASLHASDTCHSAILQTRLKTSAAEGWLSPGEHAPCGGRRRSARSSAHQTPHSASRSLSDRARTKRRVFLSRRSGICGNISLGTTAAPEKAERTARTTASMPHTTLSMPRSCVVALPLDAACSQGVSCSHYTQTAITTSTIGTQCSLTSLISAGSQTEAGFGGGTAKTTASMPHTTLLMPISCVVALSLDAACSQGVSCSHYTQTAITTSTIGTQCSLTSLISAGSQTKAGFAALEVNNTQVGDSGASDNSTTSRDGADISAELSPHTSSSSRHSGKTGLGECCAHVAALLFRVEASVQYGLNNPSPTDIACK